MKTIYLLALVPASLLVVKSMAQPTPIVVSVPLVDLVKDCYHRDATIKKKCEDKSIKLVLNPDGTVGWRQ